MSSYVATFRLSQTDLHRVSVTTHHPHSGGRRHATVPQCPNERLPSSGTTRPFPTARHHRFHGGGKVERKSSSVKGSTTKNVKRVKKIFRFRLYFYFFLSKFVFLGLGFGAGAHSGSSSSSRPIELQTDLHRVSVTTHRPHSGGRRHATVSKRAHTLKRYYPSVSYNSPPPFSRRGHGRA